jgi:4-hydroxybenzoyl-CoA thioesterase
LPGRLTAISRRYMVSSGTGVPTLSIECEFTRPSRLGDRLVFELGVERMGKSSFTLDVVATDCDGEQRVKAHIVLACIDLETGRARPIPEEIRSRMVEFELRRAG